jgi:hypothetical protein
MAPKVLFISTWINNPELIPIQRDLIKKFCSEDAELLAVLDGKPTPCFTNFGDTSMRQRQINTCRTAGITFVEVPPELHTEPHRAQLFSVKSPGKYTTDFRNYELDPSSRTAVSNQFGWRTFHQYLASSYDYLVMIQSDVFPFRPFSVREMLDGNSLLYKDQERAPIHYAWDGFLMFDFTKDKSIPWNEWNFDSGIQHDNVFTDTGGGTWPLLLNIPLKKSIDAKNSLQWSNDDPYLKTLPVLVQAFLLDDVRNKDNKIFSEIKHHHFVHLRGGGNWEFIQNLGEGIVIQKTRFEAFAELAQKLL